ncbi:MMPL family transporter [Actinocorallia longicatena]|uniref:MMPL family transporter n=1 Tax=Actinocorallia longicatena TaxID=111803 RepID=A0ABP6Q4R5_9ACTN
MLSQLSDLVLRYPRRFLWGAVPLVVAGLIAGAVASVTMTMGLGDYDDPDSPSARAQHEVLLATGIDPEQGYLVLVRTGRVIDPARPVPAEVTRAESLLRGRPEVRAVQTYATTRDPRMISADGRATFIAASVGHFTGNRERDAVAAVESGLDADPLLRDRTWLGGPTTANVQVSNISTLDLALAETAAFPVLLILLLFVFRGAVAAVIPLLGAGYTIAVALLGLGAVMPVLKLSVFALNLLLALGVGLAVDFSLLMVSRFREELGKGLPTPAAVRVTVATAGRTVLFSALTVGAALASLLLFPQRFLYSMGLAGVLTALAAASFALVVLPAMLALLGARIDKWAPRRFRAAVVSRHRWYRFSWTVMRRPLVLGGAAALVLVLLGAPFAGIRFTGVDASVLPADASAGQVSRELERAFPDAPATPIRLVVTAPDSARPALASYAKKVAGVPGVAAAGVPVRLAHGLWQIEATPASAALSPQARAALGGIERIPAPYPVRATGQTAQFSAMQDSLGSHLPLALGLVVGASLVLLFALTGSVILPIKALIMNALSLSAAFGALVFIFQDGHLEGLLGFTSQGALESTSPIILFALAFGLSTDYTVFLLSRIKECHDEGLPTREAVAVALDRTGRIVTMAAVLLAVAVGALTLSRLGFIKQLGLGTAVAVLVDATVVRAVLVPALMALMRDANWWAPGPLRRFGRPAAPPLDLEAFRPERETVRR